jgi:uncharacterized protein YggU (UPF0235/DUF167 family)
MYIKIRITPNSKIEKIDKISGDHYRISVKEKAENNHANNRLLEIIREEYPDSIVKIISGHHSPSKILSIEKR